MFLIDSWNEKWIKIRGDFSCEIQELNEDTRAM